MNLFKTKSYFILLLLTFLGSVNNLAADGPKQHIPDLTKGERLTRFNDLSISPIGVYSEIWRARQRSNEHDYIRQFIVRKVDQGSPSDGLLFAGDVVLGVDGTGAAKVKPFSSHPKRAMAEAINGAESRTPAQLKLLIWRPAKKSEKNSKSKVHTVSIKLQSLGSYADSAPYNCSKSQKILRKLIKTFYEENKDKKGDQSGLGILMFLAANDPTNPENDKYQAIAKKWAHEMIVLSRKDINHNPWYHGYRMISLAEYYLKTKDQKVFPTLKFYAQEWARKCSWFGTTGHRWSEKKPDGMMGGRIAGYGPILASSLPGFLGMVLAREAGVECPELEAAIKRTDIFLASYACRNVFPYGEHGFGYEGGDQYDINGKASVAGFAFALLPHRQKEARWTSKISTAAAKGRKYAHGGPYPAQLWNPIGAGLGGEGAASHHFHNVRWHMDLNRGWDGKVYYDGKQAWRHFPNATTMLFAYALPLKQLYITGRDHKKSWQLSDEELSSVKESQNFNPSKKSNEELITELSSWAGINRSKSVEELARRAAGDTQLKKSFIDKFHKMALDKTTLNLSRAGACSILVKMADPSSIKVLLQALEDEDALVKVIAAKGLGSFPREEVIPHINTILDLTAASIKPTFPMQEGDPLQYAHGHLCKLLFGSKWGLLKNNIDGIDRKKLLAAARAVALNPAGGFRSEIRHLYKQLNKEETLMLGETIVEGIRTPAPADSMFHGGIINGGMELLSRHSIEEGLLLGGTMKVSDRVKTLSKFNLSGLSDEVKLEVLQKIGDIQLIEGVDTFKLLDSMFNNGNDKPRVRMKQIHSVKAQSSSLKLPQNKTQIKVMAVNYSRLKNPKDTTYTWRKVYGPGKVSFSSNGSWESKETMVTFVDSKAGNYRFEVSMTDDLDFYKISETIDIELRDRNGRLPKNKIPTAQSTSLSASAGTPKKVTLKGNDPDGDELGFLVKQPPKHGKIKGFGAKLIYTANFDYSGPDSFTFEAIDGKGGKAEGTVKIEVSDQNIPVAVYEGFNYLNSDQAKTLVNGLKGNKSFGFSSPWEVSKNSDLYTIHSESLSPFGIPTNGGKAEGKSHHRMMFRKIDASVISKYKLLNNGSELWFSSIVSTYKNSRFKFGFKTEKDNESLSIATDRGLVLQKDGKTIAKQPWNRGNSDLKYPIGNPWILLGHCVWGKTEKDPDIIKIYRVFNVPNTGPVVLWERPVLESLEQTFDQEKLNTFFFSANGSYIDEIRIGTSSNSVLMGTKPHE